MYMLEVITDTNQLTANYRPREIRKRKRTNMDVEPAEDGKLPAKRSSMACTTCRQVKVRVFAGCRTTLMD